MDQDTVVTDQIVNGKRLIEALRAAGFAVSIAFWAKPTEEEKWYLYLASPMVDEKGSRVAYGIIHSVIRQMPDLWIDPLEVKVIEMKDTMTRAALEATKLEIPDSHSAMPNAKSYPGMTRFYGSTFGGVSVDAVSIYPLVPGKWYVSEGFVASHCGPEGVDSSRNRGASKMILAGPFDDRDAAEQFAAKLTNVEPYIWKVPLSA
jgi:hypothetical protein